MDRVRALGAWLDGRQDCECDSESECDECLPISVADALARRWIEARTLTWDARREYLKTADRVAFGSVGIKVDGVRWNACRMGSGGEWFVGTREQATAWLEEQARAAGYEVAT